MEREWHSSRTQADGRWSIAVARGSREDGSAKVTRRQARKGRGRPGSEANLGSAGKFKGNRRTGMGERGLINHRGVNPYARQRTSEREIATTRARGIRRSGRRERGDLADESLKNNQEGSVSCNLATVGRRKLEAEQSLKIPRRTCPL